jgi:hypothetical protein
MKKKELPPQPKCNHFIWRRAVKNEDSPDREGRIIIVCEKCAALGVIEEGRAKW